MAGTFGRLGPTGVCRGRGRFWIGLASLGRLRSRFPLQPHGGAGDLDGRLREPADPPSCEETFRRGFGKDDVHDL